MAKNILILLISYLALSGLFQVSLAAQTKGSSPAQSRATEFAIKDPAGPTGGKLYITVAGQQRKIYDEAFEAWIISDGRGVVFSSHDGAGGFENEGQSLHIYDVETRHTRKILSEYFGINAVQAVRTSSGAIALLVKMQDGGLGGSYFAVVDPTRGEVFYRQWAEAIAISGDNITLAFYREEDFETILEERSPQPENSNRVIATTKVRPYKKETHDLKEVLKQKVIYNKPSYLAEGDATPRSREVRIYLWEVNSKKSGLGLLPVTRRIGGIAVLRLTLDMLFAGATKEEESRGLSSSTFGMKLDGVTLTDGVALIKFSQPKNATNYGSLGPMIFAEAIEKTARQFSTVKKVEICAVGETMIDSELEKPFPKCPK